jgi:hypothetical protein
MSLAQYEIDYLLAFLNDDPMWSELRPAPGDDPRELRDTVEHFIRAKRSLGSYRANTQAERARRVLSAWLPSPEPTQQSKKQLLRELDALLVRRAADRTA